MNTKRFNPGFVFIGCFALVWITLWADLYYTVQQHNLRAANDLAERELYDQRLKDEGCMVKGREGQRAIYVCPDGSATLGQVREVRQ